MRRSRVALSTVMLFVAACSPEATSPSGGRLKAGPMDRSSTPAQATPLNMTIFPNEITSDGTTTARVNVDSAISCCDRSIQVATDNPAVLPFLPTGATVGAGTSFAGIAIDPTTVSQRTVVTIFATGNGVTVSAQVIIDPPGTVIPRQLSSFTVSPTTVDAGTTATGTVTIPNPAPAGGLAVKLSSLLPDDASVPPSVTVPEAATRVSFPVTTYPDFPNSTTCVRLFATTANDEVEGDICVVTGSSSSTTSSTSPLAAPALLAPSADQRFAPGASITFDWSDIAGAASYELQIDDRDNFPAPLILDQTTTVSQLSASALPTSTMFWRVRAISSSGAAGSWSTVRRFEIKN